MSFFGANGKRYTRTGDPAAAFKKLEDELELPDVLEEVDEFLDEAEGKAHAPPKRVSEATSQALRMTKSRDKALEMWSRLGRDLLTVTGVDEWSADETYSLMLRKLAEIVPDMIRGDS